MVCGERLNAIKAEPFQVQLMSQNCVDADVPIEDAPDTEEVSDAPEESSMLFIRLERLSADPPDSDSARARSFS